EGLSLVGANPVISEFRRDLPPRLAGPPRGGADDGVRHVALPGQPLAGPRRVGPSARGQRAFGVRPAGQVARLGVPHHDQAPGLGVCHPASSPGLIEGGLPTWWPARLFVSPPFVPFVSGGQAAAVSADSLPLSPDSA